MADIVSILQTSQSDFVITTLNIQRINATVDNLYTIMNNLAASELYFDADCLHETWLSFDTDVSLYVIERNWYTKVQDVPIHRFYLFCRAGRT